MTTTDRQLRKRPSSTSVRSPLMAARTAGVRGELYGRDHRRSRLALQPRSADVGRAFADGRLRPDVQAAERP